MTRLAFSAGGSVLGTASEVFGSDEDSSLPRPMYVLIILDVGDETQVSSTLSGMIR